MSRSFSLRFQSMHVFDCLWFTYLAGDSAYTVNAVIAKSLKMKRQLCPDAVPTIDSIKNMSTQGDLSIRDLRVVRQIYTMPIIIFFLYDCKHNRELHIKCCFEMLFVDLY